MAGFGRPRPMVSVFPSLTHVAVPSLLGELPHARPLGYEARYYHPPSGEVRGGFDAESEAAMAPYHGRPEGTLGHAAVYMLSRALAFGTIRWVTRQVQQADGPWLGYLAATDGVAHFLGREALRTTLGDIFERIAALRREHLDAHGYAPDVVVSSDHGMAFSDELRHLGPDDVGQVLRLDGFTAEPGPRQVVFAPMGDVGAGAAWCSAEHAPAVAHLLATVPGVELAMAARGGGCEVLRVRDGLEHAFVAWREGRYAYRPRHGDPLDLRERWSGLPAWADAPSLRAATWDAPFPCAPQRLRVGFGELVQHPAPVLFSMAKGWTFGPTVTHAAAQLRGGQVATHGALSADQSVGFAVSTCSGWEAGPLRPAQVFAPWRDRVVEGYAG